MRILHPTAIPPINKIAQTMVNTFSEETALEMLTHKIDPIAWFKSAAIARLTEMDVEGFYAFSVIPQNTRKESEVVYMVGKNKILTAGNADDYVWLMDELQIGKKEQAIKYRVFVNLFLRMFVGRQGVILHAIDGHVLLKPGQIPANAFAAPSYLFNETGAHYSFWIFDTAKYVAVHYKVTVQPNGQVQYTFNEY
jgi:hypothetical protein